MSRISDIFSLQANALSETTQASRIAMDEASLAAKESAKFLSDSVDRTAHRTRQSIQLMDNETNRLIQAAEEASIIAERAKQTADNNSRDAFIKTTRFILEDLNSTSVDLTRILRADVPESDWKRYTNGDRSIFTRALLRERPQDLLNQITTHMKEDTEARSFFIRYVEQFDRLLSECRQSDPENLMESTVLSSDVGKLYTLIKQAMR